MGKWIALTTWSIIAFGIGFVLGLESTPGNWFYDLSYNPLTSALIAMIVPVSIWLIERRKH